MPESNPKPKPDVFARETLVGLGLDKLLPIIGPWDGEEHRLRIEAECLLGAAAMIYDPEYIGYRLSSDKTEQVVRILLNLYHDRKNQVESLEESGV